MIRNRVARYALYMTAAGLLTACIGCADRNLYNKRHFVLDVDCPAESPVTDAQVILEVRRLAIDSRFDSMDMVYRKGEFEFEADFHNEYLVSPEVMITDQVRKRLNCTGLFKKVLEPGSLLVPTHSMEGNITALYADFTRESAPTAVMEIDFFVIEHKSSEDTIVYNRNYRATETIEGSSPESVVAGLNKCLGQILTRLGEDIKAK